MTAEKTWKSSSIAKTLYDHDKERLTVEFVNGKTYEYSKVPEATWYDMLRAESVGTFFAQNIKGHFTFVQVNK